MKYNTTNSASLVVDENPLQILPRNFRAIEKIKASGSGQFSEHSLRSMLPLVGEKLWVVDLRQESHGFVNGIPISWFAYRNRGNVQKSLTQLQNDEKKLLDSLTPHSQIMINNILEKKEGYILRTQARAIIVEKSESEQALTQRLSLAGYFRFGILDHHHPDDISIEQFLAFVNTLPPDAWVHFHCRAGKGRTTTFLVMYDILKNAKQDSLETIMTRQIALGGSNLNSLPTEKSALWKKEAAMGRKNFIHNFYQYIKTGYPNISWHDWKHNSKKGG